MSVHLDILTFKYENVMLSLNSGKKVRIEAVQDSREAQTRTRLFALPESNLPPTMCTFFVLEALLLMSWA